MEAGYYWVKWKRREKWEENEWQVAEVAIIWPKDDLMVYLCGDEVPMELKRFKFGDKIEHSN